MIAYYGFDDELGAENFITDRPEGNFLDSE
jgi:hypothetical protein